MPARLAIEHGVVLRGLDHSWAVIRELGRDGMTFSIAEVQAQSNDSRGTICDFLQRLEKAGFAERAGEEPGRKGSTRKLWRLLKAPAHRPMLSRKGEPVAPRPGAGRQQMWNVIRGPMARNGFSARELAAYASTREVAVSRGAAASYVSALAAAGYLVSLGRGSWRLKPSMNSGPLPPATLKCRGIYDRNRQAIVGDLVAEEVA
jgi:hypothetical protein